MASIKIYNLQPAGLDLFNDSENYCNELKSQELDAVIGGVIIGGCIHPIPIFTRPIPIPIPIPLPTITIK